MPAYSGKFQYLDVSGAPVQQGPCEFSFDTETAILTPASGAPLAFDLGDVDVLSPVGWELTLRLADGARIQLRQFGAAFSRLSADLTAAWRDRTVRCLLLEDLAEVARYTAIANGAPAEIRIYGSNLAVLPLDGRPLQWRLAEVDSIAFDNSAYCYRLHSGADELAVTKLGQKTGEFGDRLRGAWDALRRRSAEVLHQTFPFLDPIPLQRLVALAPEGRSVKLASLATVHPKLPDALIARAVNPAHKPYFDSLKARTAADSLMTGFKFVRPDEEAGDDSEASSDPGDAGAEAESQPIFFWFFFPLAGRDIAAWEAASGTGRATYFFRAPQPVEESIARLTRGLALVNFRREPVYLPDTSLEQQPRFHRYAIGSRKLPELNGLRAAFLGRAIHSSVEEWEQQVSQIA